MRALPQRTVTGGGFSAGATHAGFGNDATVELGSGSASGKSLDLETLASLELSGSIAADEAAKPRTVAFHAEHTVEFLGGSSGADESGLTSQWGGTIAEAPDSHATLKQKETLSGSFFGSSSLIVKSRHVRPTGGAAAATSAPAESPDYELLNVIGEGGMGVVYAARQSSIARTVALKMLKDADSQSPAQREKFISEAVVTGELDHPNIVPIYDLGANNDGALFYSMKRVKGTPWHKALKQKSLDENLNILLRVADAVAFAHVNGVIHRDLKPENVMLGDFGEVLVMDWGLARVSPEFPNAASVSQSEAMGGTPAYMAPEMATGPIEKITTASDVYLLGAILYEIVAGKPPHAGDSVMACLFAAAKNKIEPTEQAGELIQIALKAMATNPSDRFASVPEFQHTLRQYQSHSQSIALVEHAQRNLQRAAVEQDYELYARALYGLEEALALWPGNARGAELLEQARVDYARLALAKADFDLGASLLDAARPDHRELLSELDAGRRERESRKRRIRLLKGAVAALVAAVVGVVSVGYAAVRVQRDEAVAQRDRAVKAEGEARANYSAAELARQEAVRQQQIAQEEQRRAVAAERQATDNFAEAVRQRTRAEQEKQEADRQRELALTAKAAEEYSAYVARIGLAKAKIDENAFDRAAELLQQCPLELRNWEWGRLNYLCSLSDRTWTAAAPVESAELSPDGIHFATGDWDGAATIWNLRTGQREQQLRQGQYGHAVAYDATGERLAAGGSDGSVHVYRAVDGELIAKLDGHSDAVLSVRFSPDGRWLLSGSYDNTARLWDLSAGKTIQVLRGHTWWVWAAEFSPDGKSIVTAAQDGKAIVWRLAPEANRRGADAASPEQRFTPVTEFTQHRGPIYAARFSPDGQVIATGGYDGRVLAWAPEAAQAVDIARRLDGAADPESEFMELAVHRGPVRTLAFAPDGKRLASGGQDNVVMVWDVAARTPLQQLRGHASHVRSCSFSANGKVLLTAGRDAQIKLWRPESYAETKELSPHDSGEFGDAVLAARFSPDGDEIVTAGRDRTARLWNAATLEQLRWFREGHDFLASSAVFFAGGARLATGAGDGTVRLWDVNTGAEIRRLDETGRTSALDISHDGRLAATGGAGNDAQIWDTTTGKKLAALQGHQAEVTAVCFAPGDQLLATGDDRGRCRIWRHDAATSAWLAGPLLEGHSRTITALRFTNDGGRLISASGDNTCGQWDVAGGRELVDLVLKHPDWVADVAINQDGKLALTCCDDGQLRLWSLPAARLLRTIEPRTGGAALTSIDMSPDGTLAAAACAADGTIRLWNLVTGEEVPAAGAGPTRAWLDRGSRGGLVWGARFDPAGRRLLAIGGNDAQLYDLESGKAEIRFSPHGVVASADVSPDGARVATGSWDRSAKIWDAATGKVVVKLDGAHAGFINRVCFSPDGRRVLTASDDGTARLWNAATGQPLAPVLGHHDGRIRTACFSPDGSRIATAGDDKTIAVVDAATGEALLQLAGHEWAVRDVAFSADGRLLISGSEDNTAIVWDGDTGARLQALAGHTGAVTSVALSPGGERALTGSQDNTAKLWDCHSGKELLTLAGHSDEITSVSFSPDGRTVLSSGRDGRMLLWPTSPWR
ncbi:MAG: protein kinase [Pirellulales bacterium]|nr:protein kinase [Pirellulales bacterium]